MAAEGFGELLDGVAEHRAGHRGGIFIEKEFEAAPVGMGRLDDTSMAEIDTALSISFGLGRGGTT